MTGEPSIQAPAGRSAFPWVPDPRDGTYRNPVLWADYSDPDVIRHGADFWLTASSFNCTPGLPILHSRDLVNWTLVNHALRQVPGERYREVQPGCGVWAPALRFHNGRFWIFFPTPDEGIYVTTADDPAGHWSEPHLVQAGRGLIDPCPLWDADGKAYLVHAYAGSRAGIKHRLRVCPMAPDGSRLLDEGRVVFHEPEKHPIIEGPKFLQRDGWYYILAPAGGVATGWQTVLRSRNIFGPYEDRIVLEQGCTAVNGPHQGALVEDTLGRWWFLHFQDAGVYGRIVHLQPARWHDGWPLIGVDQDGNGIGEPVQYHAHPFPLADEPPRVPAAGDEFESSQLGRQWQWHANHEDSWYSLTERPGWLRLQARPLPSNDLGRAPHCLLQKFPAREFVVETRMELVPGSGVRAGLVVMGSVHAVLAMCSRSSALVWIDNGREIERVSVPAGAVRLRVQVAAGGVCCFSFATGSQTWQRVGEPFQARSGVWIGAKLGLVAWTERETGGAADFDYFRVNALSPNSGLTTDERSVVR